MQYFYGKNYDLTLDASWTCLVTQSRFICHGLGFYPILTVGLSVKIGKLVQTVSVMT